MSVKKCIIPIAGRGTRFLPVTKTVSKEMLPIVNEPTILLLVKECYESGIEEIIFVVGEHNRKLVENFFTPNEDLERFLGDDPKKELLKDINEIIRKMKFHFVYQDENLRGTAGALYAAKDFIDRDEYFGVMFGDDLMDAEVPVLKQLILESEKYNCNIIGVGEVPRERVSNYGVIKLKEDNIVENIIEKPPVEEAPSNYVLQGRIVVHGTIFDDILKCEKHNNNEVHLTEALINSEEDVRIKKYEGHYYDIGSHLGFIKANIIFGLKDNKIKDELKQFMKDLSE